MKYYENGELHGKGASSYPGKGEWIMRHGSERPLIWGPKGQRPRGGEVKPDVSIVIRYAPVLASEEIVFQVEGVADDGKRIPYEQIPPNVSPIPMRRTVFHDPYGRRVGGIREEPLQGEQRDKVLGSLPFKNKWQSK